MVTSFATGKACSAQLAGKAAGVTARFDVFIQSLRGIARRKAVDRYTGMTLGPMLAVTPEKIAVFLRKMVDVTGIEPVPPACKASDLIPSAPSITTNY